MKASLVGRRAEVWLRVLAAVVGGYVLASSLAACLTVVLPMRLADAVTTGMQFSFVAYTVAAIWAFSPVPVWRMWLVMLVAALVLGSFAWGFR